MKDLIRENKGYSIFLAVLLAGCLLYVAFGHSQIRAMYEGESFGPLNDLIRYQHKKPVEHYYRLGDRAVLEAFILFGVAVPGLLVLKWLTARYAPPQVSSAGNLQDAADTQPCRRELMYIFLAALGVRAFFLPWVVNLPLAGDEVHYWNVGRMLAEGNFSRTLLHTPLWGYILAVFWAVFGHPFAGRILAVFIGAVTCVLVYLVATKAFNRRTGLLAGILFCIYPTHVGLSHSVWAEIWFGLLCALCAYLLLLYAENSRSNKYLYLTFITAGVALLSKEFALVLFAGLFMGLLFLKPHRLWRKAVVACVLFLLPATVYSIIASAITDRVVLLDDAPIWSFQLAAGGAPRDSYSFETREKMASEVVEFLRSRSPVKMLRTLRRQIYNLWAWNSFPIVRLLGVHEPENWSYGTSRPWPWVYMIICYYVFVIFTGLAGLCLADNTPFKMFSITALVCLCLVGLVGLLASKYRPPFMFVPVIYSAHFLLNSTSLLTKRHNLLRIIAMVVLLRVFVDVLYREHTLGPWG